MVMSGRSNGSLVGSTWVANSRGLVVDDLGGGENFEVLQGRDQLARLGHTT